MSIRENDPAASPDWCHSCCRLEPLPAEYYQVCGECGHVYVTAADLVAAYVVMVGDRASMIRVDDVKPEEIYFCQLCLHDF